jgi:hypothetical protein
LAPVVDVLIVRMIPVPFLRCYCSICRKTAGGG